VSLQPRVRSLVLLALALPGVMSGVRAQTPSPGSVEIGYGEARLSRPYPAWRSTYARLAISPATNVVYRFEAVQRQAFGDAGVYLGASATRPIDSAWYGFLSAGTSAGGFFFPRANVGAMLARKWLTRRQLVITSALNYFVQKDAHRDLLWTGSVVYYFARPGVIEAGVNVARSEPGAVLSSSPFLAGRLGDPRRRTFSARLSAGREAYTRLGAETALVAFNSHVTTLGWREVVALDRGFVVELEHYGNVAYRRTGVSIGAFVGIGSSR
jgi:YaiO family outer membrane protein